LSKGISWIDLMMIDGKGLKVIARSLPALEELCIELNRKRSSSAGSEKMVRVGEG
jgi:hypothetical protein